MPEKPIYAVGLDAGGVRTRCVICIVENQYIRFLGAGDVESRGWVKGAIADQGAVAECMHAALREAEQQAQVSVESAVVGIGGPTVRGANARGAVELGRPRTIEQRDVNRAVNHATYVQLMEDRMVLQIFPQDFVVDEHPGHRDPRKMVASRLEALAHLITASRVEHNALVAAVHLAHLAVEETVFEPLAACYAAVLPDDRREGVAVVDIGAQSSGMVVYYGDSLQLATSLAISGDHFTRDLARGLCVSFEDAELIKRQFGCAVSSNTPANSAVELPAPDGREAREVPRRLINRILEARAEELFRFVLRELQRVGMDRALIGGVVLTGGGSALAGLCDMAEMVITGCQARKGLPTGIRDWPGMSGESAWAAAAGLAMYSARIKFHSERQKQAAGLLGKILR
ncbi:MAG: cell division protein FtsA [Bryobacteraceae bacterium]